MSITFACDSVPSTEMIEWVAERDPDANIEIGGFQEIKIHTPTKEYSFSGKLIPTYFQFADEKVALLFELKFGSRTVYRAWETKNGN